MYETERQDLVDKISLKGIYDISVLKAIGEVERHNFVPDAMKHHAYKDAALPIGYGQTISQPYTVAFMTQALRLKPGYKVLEIGTGSGYQAALLIKMGMDVYSIERNVDIFYQTRKLLDKLGLRINTKCGDGTLGWEEYAPFNGILVTAGSPTIPKSLMKQLAVGGKMVIPVGNKYSQILKIVTKIEEENFEVEDVPEFAFVPLIGREGWKDK
ncbi:MAG: protein-L-isoaspartate O-methyltransferase [Ignavibacteria bacterium GWB2_36_8]|nr:MAG: protein-L-isoaspartate O-methyltransferase [Ignavibacteria bacterium GWB2_36_8]OGU53053.1 MAG: protein-L-isoaspartate O-methyltransferase [Ignavibacteria bacterium GWC2_36_12]